MSMQENQRIFVEVKYKCRYDDNVYTKLISICDYDIREIIDRQLKFETDDNVYLEGFELFTMNKVAKIGDML